MIRSLVRSRITTGVDDTVYEPTARAGRNPVIWVHGGSATGAQASGFGLASVPDLLIPLARDHLFPIVAPSLTVPHFGNVDARTRIDEAITWATSNLGAVGSPVLMGTSQGVTACLNYAADNPGQVACIIGTIPLIDLEAVRAADAGGLRASIDAVYNVVYPASLPEGSDPAQRTNELDLPIQLWAASDDDVSLNAASFATTTDADLYDVGPLGHDNDAVAAINVDNLVTFVETAVAL